MAGGTIGIDFGTTTTLVAHHDNGKTEIFRDPGTTADDPLDAEIIPSVVSFHPNGQVPIGRVAKGRKLLDPANTIHSFKRIIGLKWLTEQVASFRKWYPMELEQKADNLPRFVTRVGSLTAVEVATYLFGYLREQLTLAAQERVVITVPPMFRSEQRDAICEAAEHAGFVNVDLLSEPYAAALPFVLEEKGAKTVVVYDLGGGTFDLAVLRCEGGTHEVLASGGDAYLGGEDIDLRLADWMVSEVLAAYQWDLRAEKDRFKKLIVAAEQAKVRLSSADSIEVSLTEVDPVLEGKTVLVERRYLEKHLFGLAQQTFVICDEVLRSAGVRARDVDDVILAGGGAYIPYIHGAVRDYFGCEPRTGPPPDKLVVIGASMAAARGIHG